MSTGVQGYVYKAHARSELLSAIEEVLCSERFVSSSLEDYKFTDIPAATPHTPPRASDLRSLRKQAGKPSSKICLKFVPVCLAIHPGRNPDTSAIGRMRPINGC